MIRNDKNPQFAAKRLQNEPSKMSPMLNNDIRLKLDLNYKTFKENG